MAKDLDAQDSGSEKRDLLGAGRNQNQYQHQARGCNTAVRGNTEAVARTRAGVQTGNPIHIKHQEELKLKGEELTNQRR